MPKPLKPFDPADYVRPDWTDVDMIEALERRARGYSGLFREVLCTAAALLRKHRSALVAMAALADDQGDYIDELRADHVEDPQDAA